jgi:hypothetical protein
MIVGRIDYCRVMIFEGEEVGRVVYSVHVFSFINHHDMNAKQPLPRRWLRVKRGFAHCEQCR